MVYHIRRVDNQEERSIHKDDMEGLEMALREACFRTLCTKVPHEVVDDSGKRVHIVEPEPVPDVVEQDNAPPAKPYCWNVDTFYLSAWVAAMIIFVLLNR